MLVGSAADEWTVPCPHSHRESRPIACLACGEIRIAFGAKTGECPRCHYLGWTYAEELDGSTQRLIMNGAFLHHDRRSPLRIAR